MKVLVFNLQKDLQVRVQPIKTIVKDVLAHENILTDEVAIYLVTVDEICRLHQKFFNDSQITDCITFPLDGVEEKQNEYHVLGEIFICPRAAINYVQAIPDKPVDPYQELFLYLIHGLLHLTGYGDLTVAERKKMRQAEKRHMERLADKSLRKV